MGTTCSSGLNNLLQTSAVTQTTLPSWYNTAQQSIVNQAGQAASSAPQFQNTMGQNAVKNLQNPNNQFNEASGALNQIATGAANPWITGACGQVTPNTNTAMGGLFAAQRQQLCQLLPTTIAPQQAAAIGSGNFGSLRGQTSVDTAKTNAFDTLAAQQMQSALQNQATGASAGNALGNIGAQCISSNLTTGTAQMNAPFQTPGNYANLINAINAPTTATQQAQSSALDAILGLSNLACGAKNLTSALGIGCLWNKISGGASGAPITGACNIAQPGLDTSLSYPAQSSDPNAPGYYPGCLNTCYPQGSM